MFRHWIWIVAASVVLALGMTACGRDEEPEPVIIAEPPVSAGVEEEPEEPPTPIVAVVVTPTPSEEEAEVEATPAEAEEAEEAETPEAEATPTEEAEEAETPEAEATPAEEEEAEVDEEAEAEVDADQLISQGQEVYAANCAACHGPEGEGGGAYPALAGNEFLTGDPAGAIEVVHNGRGAMPAFGGQLSNEEIAAVLSYGRNSWGNEADVITPDQVAEVVGDGEATTAEAEEEQATPTPDEEEEAEATPTAGEEEEAEATPAPDEEEAGAEATPAPDEEDDAAAEAEKEDATPTADEEEEAEATPTADEEEAEAEATPAPDEEDDAAAEAEKEDATPTADEEEEAGAEATPTPGEEEEQAAAEADQLVTIGEGIYESFCAACHQPDGQGVLAQDRGLSLIYPPLAGNPFVTAEDPHAVILVVLTGRAGMPRFHDMLESDQIAAAVSYIRNAWENDASPVSVQEVEQVLEDYLGQQEADD